MKSLKDCLVVEANEQSGITYYNGEVGGWVTTDKATYDAYRKKAEEMCDKYNKQGVDKKVDADGLFDGVEDIWGSERTKSEVYAVFDKSHESWKFGQTLPAIIEVGTIDNYSDARKKYNDGSKYYVISGCVTTIRGKKVFDMYLS